MFEYFTDSFLYFSAFTYLTVYWYFLLNSLVFENLLNEIYYPLYAFIRTEVFRPMQIIRVFKLICKLYVRLISFSSIFMFRSSDCSAVAPKTRTRRFPQFRATYISCFVDESLELFAVYFSPSCCQGSALGVVITIRSIRDLSAWTWLAKLFG